MDLLKMDKNMFLSIVNMKLRDSFSDIEDLCSYFSIEVNEFYEKLSEFSLIYDRYVNQIKNL